jgi:hypothetical protein
MSSRQRPSAALFWAIAVVCTLLLAQGGCNSPRIIVVGGQTPSPTPTGTPSPITGSPSPTPIPTLTPIPTPTPFGGMDTVARKDGPAQFLFTVSPDSPLMDGFRINGDGSLSPVLGSPFVASVPMRFAVSAQNALIVASQDAIFAFAVDKETGAIRQTDSAGTGGVSQLMTDVPAGTVLATTSAGTVAFTVSGGKLKALPGSMTASQLASARAQAQPAAVLDASGRFMYVVDAAKAELAAFQVESGKPVPLSPSAYPVPRGTTSVALVKPEQ